MPVGNSTCGFFDGVFPRGQSYLWLFQRRICPRAILFVAFSTAYLWRATMLVAFLAYLWRAAHLPVALVRGVHLLCARVGGSSRLPVLLPRRSGPHPTARLSLGCSSPALGGGYPCPPLTEPGAARASAASPGHRRRPTPAPRRVGTTRRTRTAGGPSTSWRGPRGRITSTSPPS